VNENEKKIKMIKKINVKEGENKKYVKKVEDNDDELGENEKIKYRI
jgi:hypothetical protein